MTARRRLLPVLLLGVLILTATAIPASANIDNPPVISSASFSPTSLPNTGGLITVTAHVVDDAGVQAVFAQLSGDLGGDIPMSYAGSDNYTGTFDIGPNHSEIPLTFYVQVYATDIDDAPADHYAGQGSVAETIPFDELPMVWDPSVTPTSLPVSGGTVTLAVTAADTRGILEVYALLATGPGDTPDYVPLDPISFDRFQSTFWLPANTSNSALTYFVNFVAVDDAGQQASVEGSTVTVAGRPTGLLEIRPGDRDFGKVKIGKSAARTVVVRNLGGKGTFPVAGVLTASAPFSVVGQTATGLPFTLKPGETKTFTVRFAPTSLGLKTGKVNVVRSDDKQAGLFATVTGRGI